MMSSDDLDFIKKDFTEEMKSAGDVPPSAIKPAESRSQTCYGCQMRRAGCHAECEIGKRYTAELTARNQAAKAERDKDTYFVAYKVDRIFETRKNAPALNMRQRKEGI